MEDKPYTVPGTSPTVNCWLSVFLSNNTYGVRAALQHAKTEIWAFEFPVMYDGVFIPAKKNFDNRINAFRIYYILYNIFCTILKICWQRDKNYAFEYDQIHTRCRSKTEISSNMITRTWNSEFTCNVQLATSSSSYTLLRLMTDQSLPEPDYTWSLTDYLVT